VSRRQPKGPLPTPGQVNLAGKVLPDEPVNRMLVAHGFRGWRDQGVMFYTDPFRPTVHLSAAQAKRLLRERLDVVGFGGFRVRYPQTHYSEVRMGQRRATKEGAWHELRNATGEATSGKACAPGWWIIDGSDNARVWPPVQEDPPKVEPDLDD
jgi:hypothetical protein